MNIGLLGETQITVRAKGDGTGYAVDICAEKRANSVHMDITADETLEQFSGRIKSMLRSLINEGIRESEAPPVAVEAKKKPTFEEQKKAMEVVKK